MEGIRSVIIDGKAYYLAMIHPNWLKLLKEPYVMIDDALREMLDQHIRTHGVVLLLDCLSDMSRGMTNEEDDHELNRSWCRAALVIEGAADLINHLEEVERE